METRMCKRIVLLAFWLLCLTAAPAAAECDRSGLVAIGDLRAGAVADGHQVSTEGVVTGVFLGRERLGGFFLQDAGEPPAGLFVHAPDIDAGQVAPGRRMQVDGRFTRFHGRPQVHRISALRDCGVAGLPEPVPLRLPDDAHRLPSLQDTRVRFEQVLTVTGNRELHRYGTLRLSAEALTALVRPVLIAEPVGRPRPLAPLVRRELRRRADGNGWTGVTVVGNGGFLPALLLPGVDEDLRLRFLPRTPTDKAVVSLLGIPEGGGWRLLRVIGRGDVELALAPEELLALSAYADGHLVGEAVVDAGLPALADAPRLWRSAEASSEKTVRLVPLSESGRTRGAQVWLQATKEAEPKSFGGVSVGPAECVSDGRLWPLNGQGEIEVGGVRLRVLTGAEVDEEHAQLLTSGRPLVGWRAVHGMQLLCGTPVFWGSSGGTPLRRLWRDVEMRQIPSVLCGQIAEWRRDGQVVARLRTIILPEALALCLRETRPGVAVLQGQGLVAGWHVALLAAGADERAVSDANGRVVLTLTVRDAVPGLVRLRLSEPVTGEALMLEAPWPARTAMLVDPSGVRLQRNRAIACASLSGWRGFVPVGGGTLQLRVANDRATVGMKVEGEVRLAAHEALWRSILALAGPDARVNLRLIAGGDAGHRLELGRYDWQAEMVGYCCRLGVGRAILHAITLEEPLLVKIIK